MLETWKPIIGTQQEVSDHGRLRSWASRGSELFAKEPRLLKTYADKNGYIHGSIFQYGRRKNVTIHPLVAEAFIGPRPPGMQINHIDGDKSNNRPSNLEYVTCQANLNHAISIGLRDGCMGENHHNAKATVDEVREIKKRLAAGVRQVDVAREFNRPWNMIHAIRKGHSWRFVQITDNTEEPESA